MASPSSTRIWFRIVIMIGLMVVLFYVGRPLYWKISATIHDIRHNKQSVREGNKHISLFLRWILDFFFFRFVWIQVYRRSYTKRRDRWDGITMNRIQGTRNRESPLPGGFFRRRSVINLQNNCTTTTTVCVSFGDE